jgi:hypothetical protein
MSGTDTAEKLDSSSAGWRLGTRISFRFGYIYWLLYSMPIPGIYRYRFVDRDGLAIVWHNAVPWFSRTFLGQDLAVTGFQGAGDSAFNYTRALLFVLRAAAGTAIWSLADRKTTAYPNCTHGCGCTCDSVSAQRSSPTARRTCSRASSQRRRATRNCCERMATHLLRACYGRSWRHLARTSCLRESIEVAGGALLFFPRLSTLGALLCAACPAQVFMLNMSYDVPVKLY